MSSCKCVDFTQLDEKTKLEVLDWRNDVNIRRHMLNCNIISKEEHLGFIKSLANDKTKRYYLVNKENTPIGAIYLTGISSEKSYAEGGLYANPSLIGTGIGKELLGTLLEICSAEFDLKKLVLTVNKSNSRALQLYLNMGFSIEDENAEYYIAGKVLK